MDLVVDICWDRDLEHKDNGDAHVFVQCYHVMYDYRILDIGSPAYGVETVTGYM